MSKNIFATITHVAEKITEAITGHKNDEQAHPNLSEQINVLSGKIDIGILRSGTLAEYILKHGRNGGVGGNTYEASMTDLPEQRWGMFHVMKHASEVWTVIWYSDYNSTHYKRQLRSEGWVTEWEPIATTSKTDISYTLNGGLTFRSENDSKGEYTETLASIRIMIDVNNADIFNWDFVWCTLPPQLRPRHQLSDILLDSGTGIVSINVLPNGNIIRGNLMPETKPTWIMGYVPMYGRSM